jgi:hypothetical protein
MPIHSIRWPTEHTEYTEAYLVSLYPVGNLSDPLDSAQPRRCFVGLWVVLRADLCDLL